MYVHDNIIYYHDNNFGSPRDFVFSGASVGYGPTNILFHYLGDVGFYSDRWMPVGQTMGSPY